MTDLNLSYQSHHIFPRDVLEKLQPKIIEIFGSIKESPIELDNFSNRVNLLEKSNMADLFIDDPTSPASSDSSLQNSNHQGGHKT